MNERYTGKTFRYAKDSSDPITGVMNNATNIFVTGDMTHVTELPGHHNVAEMPTERTRARGAR